MRSYTHLEEKTNKLFYKNTLEGEIYLKIMDKYYDS